MRKIIFIAFILLVAGYNCAAQPESNSGVQGLWIAEKHIFASRELYLEKYKDEKPTEKYCINFTTDGKIFRFSNSLGQERLYGEYRVNGNTLELSVGNKKEFIPMGQLIYPDQLLMNFKRGRKVLMRKLPDSADPKNLDLSGVVKIEFEKQS